MRHVWVVRALLAAPLSLSAVAAPDYMKCLDQPRTADCLARLGSMDRGVYPVTLQSAVIRHGLVDLVSRHSLKLHHSLPGPFHGAYGIKDPPPGPLRQARADRALRYATKHQRMAALALLSSARYETDPFSNPVVTQLMKKAGNDPLIPALAITIWTEFARGQHWLEEVPVLGLPALWEHTLTLREQAPGVVRSIAIELTFRDQLRPQLQEYFAWLARNPGESAEAKSSTASFVARNYRMVEEAERIVAPIVQQLQENDLAAARYEIAMGRLLRGPHDASARIVAEDLAASTKKRSGDIWVDGEWTVGLLARSGAQHEVHWLAAELIREAEALEPSPGAAQWYASASECYRALGDLERARAVARRGVPYVRELVAKAIRDLSNPVDLTDPAAMTREAHGRGTEAVVALYRAGGIDEAVKTGFISGSDRYENAELAGEEPDPWWAINDASWHGRFHLVKNMTTSSDRARQRRAYDALVKSCGGPLAQCKDETLESIALIAAAMVDEPRMREAYTAMARKLADSRERSFSAISLAARWAHAEEVMRNQLKR
jgi:hypothetical protein